MAARAGCVLAALWWLFLRINVSHSSGDIKDLLPLKCRIAGVVLVERKYNYTTAEAVCGALGLQLASRTNVQKAWKFGFETCSYGWVMEKYGIISRIQNNEKCGRNQTGVLTWTVPLSHLFSAYCFNASDLQINSCKPELMVTIRPSTAPPPTTTPMPQVTTPPPPDTTFASTTTREPTNPPLLTTLRGAPKTTETEVQPATTPRVTTPPPTTPPPTTPPPTDKPTNPPENQPSRSEKIVFGKLPTALLILALVFFLAAIVLAICYIKKYKTNVFFRKIKEESECVETKTFKETSSVNHVREEETAAKEEKASNMEAGTGSGLEATV